MQIWQELISAAIIGTEQQKLQFAAVESNELQQLLTQIEFDDRESALLKAAAMCALWRKTGNGLATDKKDLPDICAPEISLYISDNAAAIFDRIADQPNDRSLSGEFLELAARHGRLIPPRMLSKLFWRFRKEPEMQIKLLPLVGERGCWLARRNVDLRWILICENVEEAWETGDSDERRLALRWRREQQPNEAREMLAATWKTESAKDRAMFLEILRINLSIADEPFLSEVLRNDKSADVRRAAFEMNLRLPDSKLVAELADRAAQILILEQSPEVSLQVNFPPQFEVSKTDVLNNLELYLDERKLGAKAVFLVKLLSCVPVGTWEKVFAAAPPTIIAAAARSEWSKAVLLGFKFAALNFAAHDWLTQILPAVGQNEYYSICDRIERLWTNEQIEDLVVRLLKGEMRNGISNQFAGLLTHRISRFWSSKFTEQMLDFWRQYQSNKAGFDASFLDALTSSLLYSAHHLSLETISDSDAQNFVQTVMQSNQHPNIGELTTNFLSDIKLRREMHQAF